MPLSEKARIEVYLPDLPRAAYQDLLGELAREFTYTFGGCTIRGLEGNYLARLGARIRDRVNVVYTDAPFAMETSSDLIGRYVGELHDAAIAALEERLPTLALPDRALRMGL